MKFRPCEASLNKFAVPSDLRHSAVESKRQSDQSVQCCILGWVKRVREVGQKLVGFGF